MKVLPLPCKKLDLRVARMMTSIASSLGDAKTVCSVSTKLLAFELAAFFVTKILTLPFALWSAGCFLYLFVSSLFLNTYP